MFGEFFFPQKEEVKKKKRFSKIYLFDYTNTGQTDIDNWW